MTGRHHQDPCSDIKQRIWNLGDTYNPIYQKTKKKYKEIGLFAARIAFEHPTTGERMVFKADPSGEAFDLLEMTE